MADKIIRLTAEEQMIYTTLGARIHSKRVAKGITQQDLADELGMTRSNLANIECGNQGVPVHVGVRICRILKMKLME